MFIALTDWVNSLNFIDKIKSEEDTKRVLIYPFLSLLGVNIYNMSDCECEYFIEVGNHIKDGQLGFVDICLKDNDSPFLFIEAKKSGLFKQSSEVIYAFNQLSCYFKAYNLLYSKKIRCISTDGLQWNFYIWDLNDLQEAPVFSFNILDIPKMDETYFIQNVSRFFGCFMYR